MQASLTDFVKWINPLGTSNTAAASKVIKGRTSIDLEAGAPLIKQKKKAKEKDKKIRVQQVHPSGEVDDVNLPSSSPMGETSPTSATQSVVHSAKNDPLSLLQKEECAIITATTKKAPSVEGKDKVEANKGKKKSTASVVEDKENAALSPEDPLPPLVSMPISEYVSVNEQAKSLEELGGLSELAVRLLHKRRLKEHGFRLSGGKMLGEGGFGAVFKVYQGGGRLQPLACKVMLLTRDGRNRGGGGGGHKKGAGNEGDKKEKKENQAKKKKPPPAPLPNVVGANPAAVPSMLQTFSNEVFVMSRCRHENLIGLKQFFIYSHSRSSEETLIMHSYLIMEYAALGTLYAKLKKNGPFEEAVARGYFLQTAKALEHLHTRGIAHRDLKLGNILLAWEDDREVLKVTDFGLSRQVHTEQSGLLLFSKPAGTMSYMAPELVDAYVLYNSGQRKAIVPYDCFAVDIWALGVCLYMLLAKVHPYGSPPAEKAERVAYAKVMHARQLAEQWEPLPEAVKAAISWPAVGLLQGLMEVKPELRLTIYQVMKHTWLQEQSEVVVMKQPDSSSLS